VAVKIFILGRPGSGKTTAACRIAELAETRGYSSIHVNDYEILYQMFKADTEYRRFRPTAHNGFDVCDFSVLDIALSEVEKRVQADNSSEKIITIEFARDDYSKALRVFNRSFLRDAYFLFIDAEIDICLQRIHERVAHPTNLGDHPSLSDDAWRLYYGKDNRPYMASGFSTDFNIDCKRVKIIDNNNFWQSFRNDISEVVDNFFSMEMRTLQEIFPLVLVSTVTT
jgi:adenylate kinase family enzyme